jgi:hypothetical protein
MKEIRDGSRTAARGGCECDQDDEAWVPRSHLLGKPREDSMRRTPYAIEESFTTSRMIAPGVARILTGRVTSNTEVGRQDA